MSDVKVFVLAGLLIGLALAIFVSPFASSSPDGLEKVAEEQGFGQAAEDSGTAGSPLAGYSVKGVSDDRIGTGVAGLIGTLITFGLGLALFGLVRRSKSRSAAA